MSDKSRKMLDEPLIIEEFDNFMDSVKKNTAPGISGLPYSCFECFWPYFRYPIFQCAKEIEKNGIMPEFLRKAVLSLLHKGAGKDRRQLKSWRPLLLQECLYKMYSAVFTNRLNLVTPEIIKGDQYGFIKSRCIDDNIRLVSAVLEYAKKAGKRGIILAIDFNKAFDSLSHNFILKSLDFFGSGGHFKRWVKIFLSGKSIYINHANKLLQSFPLERGVAQGDPLSPCLFIIALEVLLIKLRNCPEIKRYKINNDIIIDLTAYADDLNILFSYDETSLRAIMRILDEFKLISGLKVNESKTQLMVMGRDPNVPIVKLCPDIPLKWTPVVRFLEVELDYLYISTDSNNDAKLEQIYKVVNAWEHKFLSPSGGRNLLPSN